MKNTILLFSLFIWAVTIKDQELETFYLPVPISNHDTIFYKFVIQLESKDRLYHVRDYYPSGQIQMEETYASFDKQIKEESIWCNYLTNTKEGEFKVWYKNGKIESKTNYLNGLRHGQFEYWYANGHRKSIQNYMNGREHGKSTQWNAHASVGESLSVD